MYDLFSVSEIEISYKPRKQFKDLPQIKSSSDAYDIAVHNWTEIEYRETFSILLLNSNNRVIGIRVIGKGGIASTIADPKMVFQAALKANACALILVHNHPSGSTKASTADIALTKNLVQAGKFLSLSVLDHIIITPSDYYSFADNNEIAF